MNLTAKISFVLVGIILMLVFFTRFVGAAEDGNCVTNYGGTVCGAATPPIIDTAGETDLLYTASGLLYSTGLASFILAKKSSKLVPLR